MQDGKKFGIAPIQTPGATTASSLPSASQSWVPLRKYRTKLSRATRTQAKSLHRAPHARLIISNIPSIHINILFL